MLGGHLIRPVNHEKKGIILKVSFLCCCSALWVIKVSCIRFTPAKIAIYNDLTFLFKTSQEAHDLNVN